ncbi:Protein of unknown function, partial [Gryllus bimaculatus]
ALHPRAKEALLVWRAPPSPAPHSAPDWLTAAHGYVIAARRAARVEEFLIDDLIEPDIITTNVTWTTHKRLGSSGRVVVYVLEERSRGRGRAEVKYKLKYDLRNVLWLIHQSFNWLLVWQGRRLEAGIWRKLQKPFFAMSTFPLECLGLVCYDEKAARQAR